VNQAPDPKATARTALACLDLTSLNDADTEADIAALCARAVGPAGRGATAAVCVWPRLAAFARAQLDAAGAPQLRVAAVANFPDGSADVERAVRDTVAIVAAGAQEVDVVLPYTALDAAPALLAAVRRESAGLTLKVILETGMLATDDAIQRACDIALAAGADFLKTSTGKVPVNATPHAARLLLQAIAALERREPAAAGRIGFKPAGGIRTVADAGVYIALVAEILGPAAVSPARLRLGASGLLNDIEAVLAESGPPSLPAGSASSY
jgi:deoxyribose-phosphate aldolase